MSENEIVGMTYMQALEQAQELCESNEAIKASIGIIAQAKMLALNGSPAQLQEVSNAIHRLISFIQTTSPEDKNAVALLRYADGKLDVKTLVPRITQADYDQSTGLNRMSLQATIKGNYLPFKQFQEWLLDALFPKQKSICVTNKRNRYLELMQEKSLVVKVDNKYYYHPELLSHDIFVQDGRTKDQRDKGHRREGLK